MKEYTKEQKAEYFKALRDRWAQSKELSEKDNDAKSHYEAMRRESPTASISYTGFYFALMAMRAQNLNGIPYVDAKTFNGWITAGFKVKRGEKSTIEGITWIKAEKKTEDADDKLYPKRYALFHKTQVEEIRA